MKITKDEARILSSAINDYKFRLKSDSDSFDLFDALETLEIKLEKFGKDKRRTGRTSQDSFSDLLKRYVKNNKSCA